jgi:hypothetical protein
MKRIGWRGESYRHYLASKGVSTGVRKQNRALLKSWQLGKLQKLYVDETTGKVVAAEGSKNSDAVNDKILQPLSKAGKIVQVEPVHQKLYMGPKLDLVKKMLLPHRSDEQDRLLHMREDELRNMTYDRMAKEEASGNLTSERSGHMVELLDGELSMLRQGVSFPEVKHELARKLDNHVRHHSRKGLLFSDDGEKLTDVHTHPGVMPYNNHR